MMLQFVKDMIYMFVNRKLFTVVLIGSFAYNTAYADTINVQDSNFHLGGDNAGLYYTTGTDLNDTVGFRWDAPANMTISSIKLGLYSVTTAGPVILEYNQGGVFESYILPDTSVASQLSEGGSLVATPSVQAGDCLITDINSPCLTEFVFDTPLNITSGQIYHFAIQSEGHVYRVPYAPNKSSSLVRINSGVNNFVDGLAWTGSDSANDVIFAFGEYFDPEPELTFDILGSTSPATIMANVTSGVQSTGGASWPLLGLIGVPTAFVIGRRVIGLIRLAV